MAQMKIDPTDYYRYSLKAALTGNYTPHGHTQEADCLIAAAFGERQDGSAGQSNLAIAAFINSLALGLPVIAQAEISNCLKNDKLVSDIHTISQARQPGQRLDTQEFLEQAGEYMQQHGYKTALLVGHPNHLPWLDFLCTQLGIDTVVADGLQSIPFDTASSQPWTRSLPAWQAEVLARQQAGDERTALS